MLVCKKLPMPFEIASTAFVKASMLAVSSADSFANSAASWVSARACLHYISRMQPTIGTVAKRHSAHHGNVAHVKNMSSVLPFSWSTGGPSFQQGVHTRSFVNLCYSELAQEIAEP
eukprot:2330864-Amphidinium_carterae.1